MTRFPIGKGARMIRPVLAQSYPLIVSRSYCYRHRNGFQWSAVSSSAAPSLVRSICSASSASFRRRSLCDDCGGAICGGSLHGHTLHGGHDRPRCLPLDRWHHGGGGRPPRKAFFLTKLRQITPPTPLFRARSPLSLNAGPTSNPKTQQPLGRHGPSFLITSVVDSRRRDELALLHIRGPSMTSSGRAATRSLNTRPLASPAAARAPPAQNRTCGFLAYGKHLPSMARSRADWLRGANAFARSHPASPIKHLIPGLDSQAVITFVRACSKLGSVSINLIKRFRVNAIAIQVFENVYLIAQSVKDLF